MIRAAHKNIVNQDCLSIVYLLYPQLLSAYCQYCLSIAFLSMIDTQIRASLWRRSRTDFNTSKNNIVDFYFLQQNNFPWRMRVFHCCRRLLLHNITRRTIGEQISIECFGFGRDDSFDIYVFNPFIKNQQEEFVMVYKVHNSVFLQHNITQQIKFSSTANSFRGQWFIFCGRSPFNGRN